MAYAYDLLDLAQHLANLEPANPRQACLRRAISTAYYALFHLLISEATLNWGRPELRSELGRVVDHGRMKSASEGKRSALNAEFGKNPPPSQELLVSKRLHTVADTFIQVQQKRTAPAASAAIPVLPEAGGGVLAHTCRQGTGWRLQASGCRSRRLPPWHRGCFRVGDHCLSFDCCGRIW